MRLTPHAGFGGKLPGKDPGSSNMNAGLAGQLTLPNDAFSVAVAALRSPGVREASRDDHATVLKIWSKRYKDLSRTRTQVACRLHQVLCELIPGGVPGQITAGQSAHILGSITPSGAVAAARCQLAAAFTEDLRGIDAAIRDTRKQLATAVQAAGTSLTGLFGVGPVIAAAVIGDVRHVSRFPGRDHFAADNGTAPSRCPPAAAKSGGCPGAVTAASTTPSTWPRSPRSATATATAAPTTSANWPKARPPKKPSAPSSAASATPSSPARRPTPARPPRSRAKQAREGTRGRTPSPARPAHTPYTGSSAKPLPDPLSPYGHSHQHGSRRPTSQEPADPLTQRGIDRCAVAAEQRSLSIHAEWLIGALTGPLPTPAHPLLVLSLACSYH